MAGGMDGSLVYDFSPGTRERTCLMGGSSSSPSCISVSSLVVGVVVSDRMDDPSRCSSLGHVACADFRSARHFSR